MKLFLSTLFVVCVMLSLPALAQMESSAAYRTQSQHISTLRTMLGTAITDMRASMKAMREMYDAKIASLETKLSRYETCANRGELYAPANANAGANGCMKIEKFRESCAPKTVICDGAGRTVTSPALEHGQSLTMHAPGTVNNYCYITCWDGQVKSTVSGN